MAVFTPLYRDGMWKGFHAGNENGIIGELGVYENKHKRKLGRVEVLVLFPGSLIIVAQ